MKKQNVYADKFFAKKMHPGVMGDGFVGVITDSRKKKSAPKLFPRTEDFLEE